MGFASQGLDLLSGRRNRHGRGIGGLKLWRHLDWHRLDRDRLAWGRQIIVIGRSGSSVTAELGTMKVGEEIEALEVMAINPVRFLVVPRFLAMLVMLPALTVFGDCVGIAGGWVVCHYALDFTTPAFILRAVDRAEPWDLYSGLVKSVVFAWITITIACQRGLNVEGGAEGVGNATTQSVVWSLLMVLVANALLTGVFFFAA